MKADVSPYLWIGTGFLGFLAIVVILIARHLLYSEWGGGERRGPITGGHRASELLQAARAWGLCGGTSAGSGGSRLHLVRS